MAGIGSYDLKDEDQAKEYLDELEKTWLFDCFSEKSSEGNWLLKDIINLYFTKFAVICLSPSISPSNQHINGCFILTENWYALPMVFFLFLGTQKKMTRYHILKYLGPKACQSTCSYLFWSRNI